MGNFNTVPSLNLHVAREYRLTSLQDAFKFLKLLCFHPELVVTVCCCFFLSFFPPFAFKIWSSHTYNEYVIPRHLSFYFLFHAFNLTAIELKQQLSDFRANAVSEGADCSTTSKRNKAVKSLEVISRELDPISLFISFLNTLSYSRASIVKACFPNGKSNDNSKV